MIILDLQQVMLANLHMQLGNHQNAELDENILRHMILNSIRAIRVKFPESEWGELVIACDSYNCWRREHYPYYKAQRAKNRKKSELDWTAIFEALNKVRAELKEFFPYRVVEVVGAEADDVIGTLCYEFGAGGEEFDFIDLHSNNKGPILIISGDKDFKQLHKFSNIKQYDPTRKKWVTVDDPAAYLAEHILTGDVGDGVPNVLSDDDTFVDEKKRQKALTKQKMDKLLVDHSSAERNWKRNQILIDLSMIPSEIKSKILNEYETQAGKGKSKLANYFISRRMKLLHEHINEF